MLLRTLIGLVCGVALVLLGIPVLQAVMVGSGYFTSFSFQEAALAFILILLCVLAAQLTGARSPRS